MMFRTKTTILFIASLLLVTILVSCSNDNLNLGDGNVAVIEVYKYDDDILIDTIEDKDFIDKLIKELNEARTKSTANMDFNLPEYHLIFKNTDDMNVFSIGYFKDAVVLGVEGRYIEVDSDLIYQVELALPIDINGL